MKRLYVVLVVSAMLFVSCGEKKNVLHLFNWTYYMPDSIIQKFEEKFDAEVRLDTYASNEEMFAKLLGGATGYDLVVPGQDFIEVMIKLDMISEIDLSKIPNTRYLNPKTLAKAKFDPHMQYNVPYFFGASGIMVNKTKVPPDYPRDWSIFADERFKGKMCMMDDRREVIGDALNYLGYSVNSVDDKELEEAYHLINDKWKPNLAKFDAESFGKSFASGDFWVAQGYPEVVFSEYPEDKWDDIDFFIPESGGPSYLEGFCIPRTAENRDLAHEFINFFHTPEIYAEFLDYFRFPATVNSGAAEFTKLKPHYTPEDVENCELRVELGENLQKYDAIWEKIRQ